MRQDTGFRKPWTPEKTKKNIRICMCVKEKVNKGIKKRAIIKVCKYKQ